MAEEGFPYEILSRRLITEYPTLLEEVRYWHIVFRYADLPPMSLDIPELEYTEEKEREEINKMIKEELERLGREV